MGWDGKTCICTHNPLKLLKPVATSTKLTHSLLNDMEETIFKCFKTKKAMVLLPIFIRNSVKISKYCSLNMLVFFHRKCLLHTYFPKYLWQPQNLPSENTNTDENCCDLTQWTTDFLRRYFTQIHGKGTQRNACKRKVEKTDKHKLSHNTFCLHQVQNEQLLKGVWVLICSHKWHKNFQITELHPQIIWITLSASLITFALFNSHGIDYLCYTSTVMCVGCYLKRSSKGYWDENHQENRFFVVVFNLFTPKEAKWSLHWCR